MLRAVIDVNVLVSSLLSPRSSSPPVRIRHAALTTGAARAVASADLVSELDEVLPTVIKRIGTVERAPVSSTGPAFAAVLGVPAVDLFGTDQPTTPAETSGGLTVITHQFVPAFIGAESVQRLTANDRFAPVNLDWAAGPTCELDYPEGTARAYLLERGVVVLHLSQQLALPSGAALAT